MADGIRFIRVNGRVVPIKSKPGDKKSKSLSRSPGKGLRRDSSSGYYLTKKERAATKEAEKYNENLVAERRKVVRPFQEHGVAIGSALGVGAWAAKYGQKGSVLKAGKYAAIGAAAGLIAGSVLGISKLKKKGKRK